MESLESLLAAMEQEARANPFPIDEPVYRQAERDPLVPVAYAGNLAAAVCSLGRDLGRDEVKHAQPQIGAAGKLVRRGVLEVLGLQPRPDDPLLEEALRHVLLSNIVPYKPPGNKAYPGRVRERFRPYVARLLACHWQGHVVLTLGTEAFQWFAPYAEPGAAEAFWARSDRYEAEFTCTLRTDNGCVEKEVIVCPLPHPSPLNQRWVGLFPELLRRRLERRLLAKRAH